MASDQDPPRSAFGASPPGGHRQRPGRAGSAAAAGLKLTLRTALATAVIVGLGCVPLIAALLNQPFYVTLFTRILIFAIAASGLNLILGYGALVSFGHAMYLGLGAYAVGLLGHHGITSGWAHVGAALVAGTVVAAGVGAICLRTARGGGGMAFIMITLAFAQMLFFLFVSLREYGGDDGLPVATRSDFGLFSLASNVVLYYTAYAVLLLVLFFFWRLIHARFGMVLRGCKVNERRMAALGFPTLRYKLAAYVLSALVCVLAGVLMANLTKFVAPSYMAWSVSGELIVMIVLGGMGTLIGPVVGATALLMLEEALSSLKIGIDAVDRLVNQHWLALIGLFVVAVVLVLKQGLYGRLVARDAREEQRGDRHEERHEERQEERREGASR
ncbi:MAG: branched-chain amino acid ABC transporter permease [Burkholderiales bacterium]|nr:branched-chain amino acid ABC transporter permease [Burkholderiales bacterium]